MERHWDCIIIGAGPAGMSASIYASRAGLKTAMIEAGAPGGKLIKTADIQNFPGISQSSGVDLATQMFEHSTKFGAEYLYGNVVDLKDGEEKEVICEDETYYAKTVIVATGTNERMLNIKGEKENIGRGVSYCAVCDGAFFKDRNVVVIGGGNSALEEALYLTQFAKKVTIVIRRNVFRAEALIQKQIEQNDKIEIITKHIPVEILDNGMYVTGIVFENVDTKEKLTLDTDGIFPYIGQDPATDFLKNLNVLNDYGYMIVDEHMETKVKGIYGAGDVIEKDLRQVVTATSDGAIAAQHAFHQIKGI